MTRIKFAFNIYFVAVVLSILTSAWIAAQEYVINPDAICYLQSAANMSLGLKAGMTLCDQAKWPLYSLLIYGFVKLTHFSYVNAAFILNGLFSTLSLVFFIAIVRFLNQNSKILLWLALAVFLLAHELNAVKQYIIRDHGFWAFYLLSVLSLLYFLRQPRWFTALGWSVSLVVASLFRVEGIIFLLLIPFITFFDVTKTFSVRVKTFLQLHSLLLVISISLFAWLALHPGDTLHQWGRLGEVQNQIVHGAAQILADFHQRSLALAQTVLTPEAARDAGLILFLALVVTYLIHVVSNVSVIYAGLIIYAWWQKILKLDWQKSLVIGGYILVNIIITAVFFAENLFFAKRYLIALSLMLMLWVPFALENLLARGQQQKWLPVAVISLIIIFALGPLLNLGHSKKYIYDAGTWLAQNTASQASIYSNDYQLMYYSQHFGDAIFAKSKSYSQLNSIAQGKWKQYDYLAIRLNKKELAQTVWITKELNLNPIKVFANKHGDVINIYKVRG